MFVCLVWLVLSMCVLGSRVSWRLVFVCLRVQTWPGWHLVSCSGFPVNVIIFLQNVHFAGVCVVPVPVACEAPVPVQTHTFKTRYGKVCEFLECFA